MLVSVCVCEWDKINVENLCWKRILYFFISWGGGGGGNTIARTIPPSRRAERDTLPIIKFAWTTCFTISQSLAKLILQNYPSWLLLPGEKKILEQLSLTIFTPLVNSVNFDFDMHRNILLCLDVNYNLGFIGKASFYRLHLIGLNCTFVLAVFNFSLPDIITLTSAHLYQLYFTHLYRKFFNITIQYYTMTKWFSYSKITTIFTYVISFLEIEMHLLKIFFKFWFLLNYWLLIVLSLLAICRYKDNKIENI